MLKKLHYILILTLLQLCTFSQTEDSLLKQISEIEVSLDTPFDAEENLFMNTVSFQSFYDVLSPMGEWIQITKEDIDDDLNDGEGQSVSSLNDNDELLFIWKPEVNSEWKPYMNGRWEYTDHGWLWISGDSWGNTTYNYGRWWNSPKYGWVWLPGYAWGPAWVRWKVSEGHIGWTALTPKAKWQNETGITGSTYKYKNKDNDWVFVSDVNFGTETNIFAVTPSYQYSALVSSGRDIVDIRVENEKIINTGPDVNDIEKRSGRKFQQKRLKFSKGQKKPLVGNNDVVLNRENLPKYSLNAGERKIDKPKKYKKSDRVKKILKKKKQHKNLPKRNPPRNELK